jgi:hypothetical protein
LDAWPAAGWSPDRLPALAFAVAAGSSALGGWELFEESRPTWRRTATTSTSNDSEPEAARLLDDPQVTQFGFSFASRTTSSIVVAQAALGAGVWVVPAAGEQR